MAPSFTNWLRGLKSTLLGPRHSPRSVSRTAPAPRLAAECREGAVLPALHTWTNLGSSNDWDDPFNWAFLSVPTTVAAARPTRSRRTRVAVR